MADQREWFESYAAGHQHPRNRLIHGLCVPITLWGAIALLWAIPVPGYLGRQGLWAVAVMFFIFVFYQRLVRRLALAMAVVFALLGLLSQGVFLLLGTPGLLYLGGALAVGGLAAQLAGHSIEGSRPRILRNPVHFLIGPLWLMGRIFERLGWRY